MDRLAEAFPYGCATPIRHPQSSVALRFEAATHMPRYFHTHGKSKFMGPSYAARPTTDAAPRRPGSSPP